jgi:hypothetical protein
MFAPMTMADKGFDRASFPMVINGVWVLPEISRACRWKPWNSTYRSHQRIRAEILLARAREAVRLAAAAPVDRASPPTCSDNPERVSCAHARRSAIPLGWNEIRLRRTIEFHLGIHH